MFDLDAESILSYINSELVWRHVYLILCHIGYDSTQLVGQVGIGSARFLALFTYAEQNKDSNPPPLTITLEQNKLELLTG